MTPRISVITPTKNRLKFLCQTIESVGQQDFAGWEHIIVDDGSDDGTETEVMQRAAADQRLRYIRRTGALCGPCVCRNIGIHESRGDFVIFLDSDDLLFPECLGRRIATMDRNQDLDFATFQTSVFEREPGDIRNDMDPELLGDDLLRFLLFETPWIITSPVWRKEALVRLGGFDETMKSWEDIDLHIRALTSGMRYLRFPEVDHHVRWHFEPGRLSIEQRNSPVHLETAIPILQKFERQVREGPGMNWLRQRAICSLYFLVSEFWLNSGNFPAAVRTWREIRRRPIGSRFLYLSGAILLVWYSYGGPSRRLASRVAHKWKGWMRLRMNPGLLTA